MLALYGSMGVVAGLVQVVYLVAAFVLATQLLRRARRDRDLPPLLLGLNLLLSMGFGYLLSSTGMALALLVESPSAHWVTRLLGAGYATTIAGLAAVGIFQWRVFWPDRRWPLAVVAGLVGLQLVGLLGYGWTGGLSTGSYTGVWAWLLVIGMVGINLWVGIEPLAYYAKLRKRIRLGLAEPMVADRFLLWGIGSLARAAMILLGPLAERMLLHLGHEAQLTFSAGVLALASLLGLATSVAYWLTFYPTPAYARSVERRYRALQQPA